MLRAVKMDRPPPRADLNVKNCAGGAWAGSAPQSRLGHSNLGTKSTTAPLFPYGARSRPIGARVGQTEDQHLFSARRL